ncbi:MAG: nucleotide modification associated domain-containing protein [Anaerolineae bacterium]
MYQRSDAPEEQEVLPDPLREEDDITRLLFAPDHSLVKAIRTYVNQMADTAELKGSDYGHSWRLERLSSLVDRIGSKSIRLRNLDQKRLQGQSAKGKKDAMRDEIVDMLVYLIMTLAKYDAWKAGLTVNELVARLEAED